MGYALIEVLVTAIGAVVAARISTLPLRFESPRDVGAIIAGALALAFAGAVLIGAWDYVTGQPSVGRTFRVWFLGNFVATLLVAPLIAAWARFELKRPDGRKLVSIAGGVVACVLFVVCVHALFGARPASRTPQPFSVVLAYLPFVLFVLVAVMWGARGATLAAVAAALIGITQTVRGLGPFMNSAGIFDDPVLTAQVYAVALLIAGLLLATYVERRRLATAGINSPGPQPAA